MGILVALTLLALIAAVSVVLRRRLRSTRQQRSRLDKSLPFPPWEPVGVPDATLPPIEKNVAGQLGFLDDLKRREREVGDQDPPRRVERKREQVIDAEFHEVKDNDRPA